MLVNWRNGDREALEQLMPLVYDELRRIADHYLRRERPDHTLQATALVHEVYLRLVDQKEVRWQDRAHFLAIAANLMRQILVNHAHHHRAAKRSGSRYTLSLNEAADMPEPTDVDLIALEDALQSLARLDPQKCRIVELRFFGGLTMEETAEVLGLSLRTVEREWRLAKAWLHSQVHRGGEHDA
jgi:RNA polymerase sigma factor (TIGR02999 family)